MSECEPQIQRTIIALSITAPCSIQAIEDILSIIYPGVTQSFGYIQALQIKAQLNAATLNGKMDLSAVISIAINEEFCQNEPVLAAIDLDSGTGMARGVKHSLPNAEQRDDTCHAYYLKDTQ